MELTMMKDLTNTDNLFNIFTESFICEGILYNATYIPTDNAVATVLLEKVVKYLNENIFYKNRINTITITVQNSTKITLSCIFEENIDKFYELALAAATAAYKFDLVKNYLTVNMGSETIPIHINSSNR
jgi:hypothetical protein